MFHFDIDFKDKNGERHMLPIRIGVLLEDLWCKAFPYREPLSGIEYRDGKYAAEDHSGRWKPYDREKDYWGGKDTYIWFRHRFTVPQELNGATLWYSVEAGDSGYWQWANPQMCLYLNGKCIAGMDSNHRDVEFTQCAEGGKEYEVYISGYTDTVYYERPACFRPYLACVDTEVLALYYDLKVAYDAAHEMDVDDLARVDLITHINAACNLLELTAPRDIFMRSVREASAYVQEHIYSGHAGAGKPVIAAVGSTHIDVAWLWRYEQTREKAIRSFATAIRLIDKYPEYIFMCSQPQLYDFVKQDDPALYEEIRKRVAAGRWEVEGAMWVEADTNLTGGESLVRQILFGKRFFKEEFGKNCEVLWLPDVFGYSAALPQILKKSGVPYFMTTKISWNEFNKLPYDTFYWRGIDGSEVLSHFIATKEKVQAEKDWMTTYNGELNPCSVMGAWQRYQQKDLNREILCSFGHGDGGGGTSMRMIENGRRIAKGLPGVPDLKFSGVQAYYHRLEKDLEGKKRVPCWDGELYFEYHRGTYTSVAGIKRRNRKNEIRTHDAENLSVLSGLLLHNLAESYPAEKLHESWKLLLLNQFHDVIPGSSIAPVYEDAYAHHAIVEATATEAAERALEAVCSRISAEGVAVFNTLSFARSGEVTLPWDKEGSFAVKCGDKLLPAVADNGTLRFVAQDVPPKGYRTFEVVPAEETALPQPADDHSLENEAYRIEFDENYNISRIYCKKEGRDMFRPGALAGRLIAFEDRPRVDDAWNLMAYYEEKYEYVDDVRSAKLVEHNALRTVLRVERSFRSSTLRLDYILPVGTDGLTISADIDWKETHIMLKMDFPAEVNTSKATFDIQFGSIERLIHRNTLWDYARFEVCAHKWVDLSDNGFGISLLNDCKYGYDVTREHIRLSILRCSTYPNPQQDQCRHEFSCKLLAHPGAVNLPKVNEEAYSFNYPLYARRVQGCGELPESFSLLSVDRSNIIIETVKKAEDSNAVVLRAYECGNCGCDAALRLGFPAAAVSETDLLEEHPTERKVENGCVMLHFEPFEIKTIVIS